MLERELSVLQNTNLRTQVASYTTTTTARIRAFTILRQDLHTNLTLMLRRLGKLSEDVWAAVICACSCSGTFRAAIAHPNPGDGSTLSWAAVENLIMENHVSIELFFLTRVQCDWTTFLTVNNNPFGSALIQTGPVWQVLTAAQRTSGDHTAATFGIIKGEEIPWNALETASPLHPHEWYLPGAAESGERCRITYTARTNFVPFNNAAPGRRVVNVETVLQTNREAVILILITRILTSGSNSSSLPSHQAYPIW